MSYIFCKKAAAENVLESVRKGLRVRRRHFEQIEPNA